jgi:membrane fusion protein, heavy metal efflux system
MKINLLLTLSVFLISCSSGNKDEQIAEDSGNIVRVTGEQKKNADLSVAPAEQKIISSVLRLNGVIDVPPQNKVSISVPLGGYLKESKLLPGMHINKGEIIAEMEDPQYIQLQQDYLIAKTKLGFLETEYARQKELNMSKASSDKILQQTESDYTAQKILAKSLSEKLRLISINPDALSESTLSRNIHIYSPITGYVSKVNVNIGKYTKPEEVLFEIVNPQDIHLVLHVFEKDMQALSIGQKVIVYTNSNPEKKYDCGILLMGKDFSADRSLEIHCHFKNYDASLIPGMFMNAEIEFQYEKAFVLPDEAIVTNENRKYVFIEKRGDEFEMAEVKTGKSEKGYTQIIPSDTQVFTD